MVTGLSDVHGGEAVHHRRWREVMDELMIHAPGSGFDQIRAYGYGNVPGYDGNPGERPYQHWQVTVSRVITPDYVPRGRRTRIGWRLETLAVAPYEEEVRAMRDRLHSLRDVRAPFLHGSPLRLEDESEIDRLPGADGHWGGLSTWTYVTPR